MIDLERFRFPDAERENDFHLGIRRTCYDSYYPFGVMSGRGVEELEMDHLTILYGGNGSGKSTALNVMAEKLGLARDSRYNRSSFYEDYLRLCTADCRGEVPEGSRIITSDDVFDYMLNLRALNEGIDEKREELLEEYLEDKYAHFQLRSMEDYEQLRRVNLSRRKTQSQYVRSRVMGNVREQSNGESAFFYFANRLGENALYLLDEPENSLSPARQMELAQLLEDAVRFFGCQVVMATHSPFFLSMRGARICNLDADPVTTCRWTELSAVRTYYDFFRAHAAAFEHEEE